MVYFSSYHNLLWVTNVKNLQNITFRPLRDLLNFGTLAHIYSNIFDKRQWSHDEI